MIYLTLHVFRLVNFVTGNLIYLILIPSSSLPMTCVLIKFYYEVIVHVENLNFMEVNLLTGTLCFGCDFSKNWFVMPIHFKPYGYRLIFLCL